MKKIKIAPNQFGPWLWVPLLMIVGGVLSMQVLRIFPEWLEESLKGKLQERGIVAPAIPIEEFNFKSIRVGSGTMLYGRHSLSWDSVWAAYRIPDVVTGKLEQLHLGAPQLSIQVLPTPVALPPLSVDAPGTVLADPGPKSRPREAPEEPAPAAESPTAAPAVAKVALPDEADQTPLKDFLTGIPFEKFYATEGVVDILLRDNAVVRVPFSATMERQPFGVSGELQIEHELLSGYLSMRSPVSGPEVTFQGEAVMPRGAVAQIGTPLFRNFSPGYVLPEFRSSGPLVLDAFLEIPGRGKPYGSMEFSIEELTLDLAERGYPVQLRDLIVAGTLMNHQLLLEGGAEVGLSGFGGYSVDPFAARFSYNSRSGTEFETEAFAWGNGNFSGKSAVKGSLNQGGGYQSRLEFAFQELLSTHFSMEPFSVLVETSLDLLEIRATPTGLQRNGTLWLEDLVLTRDAAMGEIKGGLSFFGVAGNRLGMISGARSYGLPGNNSSQLALMDPAGNALIKASLEQSPLQTNFEAKGTVSPDWVNEAIKWWGGANLRFSGPQPSLLITLESGGVLLSGEARLGLDDISVALDESLTLSGLRGTASFDINGLPRTAGKQSLKAERFSNGTVEFSDIDLEWSLPTHRTLRVHGLTAQIGSGQVSLEPFEMDPWDPQFTTALHFQNLGAGELLRWMGEERFQIEGTVSGTLSLGWKSGSLVVGNGSLQLASGVGSFLFRDPVFLRDRFQSFKGVSEDLRERFLATLIDEGIQILSMTAELGPADKPGHLLLKISLSGESKSDLMEVPVEGFVINNLISVEDLGELLGILAPVSIKTAP